MGKPCIAKILGRDKGTERENTYSEATRKQGV